MEHLSEQKINFDQKEHLMRKVKVSEVWFVLIMAVILMSLWAVPAAAKNNDRKLYGKFAVNFSLNCANCSSEFSFFVEVAPYCPGDALSSTYTWNVQGIYTFDGNGALTFEGRYLGILGQPFILFPGINTKVVLPAKIKCFDGGHYTVNDDLSVAAGFTSCTVYADPLEKYPIHIISNVNFQGQLLDPLDGPILLLTDTMDPVNPLLPSIEEVFTPPPFGNVTSYRICGLTGTAIPMKGKRMRKNE